MSESIHKMNLEQLGDEILFGKHSHKEWEELYDMRVQLWEKASEAEKERFKKRGAADMLQQVIITIRYLEKNE